MSKAGGGPAFPRVTGTNYEPSEHQADFHGNNGMSLRAYFAAKGCDILADASVETIEKTLGIDRPGKDAPMLEWFDFWMNWEVFRRYRYADAMLKALEEKP